MSQFICKFVPHLRHSKFHKLFFVQLSSLQVESGKSISENANHDSFTVNYFIDKCGLSSEKAVSASNYIKLDKSDKPDSCLSFLKNHGFTDTQLLKLLKKCPRVVACDPNKNLLPKIEFLHSKGFLETEIPAMLVVEPNILFRSVKEHLVPTFDLLKDHLGSVENVLKAIRRCPMILPRFQSRVLPNIRLLKEAGVLDSGIAFGLCIQPLLFACSCDKVQELVDGMKKIGIEPGTLKFIKGVIVMGSLSKLSWKHKLEVYKRWGCSEEDVLTTFKNEPWCMKISEGKIDGVMEFFVNEMGWRPQMLLGRPQLFSLSLPKRIVPRCSVYKVLLSKGLLKVRTSLYTIVKYSDDKFLEKFVNSFPDEAPGLLRLYEEKMKISKVQI